MTNDEIRSFLDQFARAWERGDAAALGACYADDCVVISPIFRTLKGRAQVERSYVDMLQRVRSADRPVDDLVIGNDVPARAVVVWTVHHSTSARSSACRRRASASSRPSRTS